jgi:3'-phosphoadenosine 5'-phosphosulfate sulfotransferase
MYKVLVRAKKDADAVKAALRVFYEGWARAAGSRRGAWEGARRHGGATAACRSALP